MNILPVGMFEQCIDESLQSVHHLVGLISLGASAEKGDQSKKGPKATHCHTVIRRSAEGKVLATPQENQLIEGR